MTEEFLFLTLFKEVHICHLFVLSSERLPLRMPPAWLDVMSGVSRSAAEGAGGKVREVTMSHRYRHRLSNFGLMLLWSRKVVKHQNVVHGGRNPFSTLLPEFLVVHVGFRWTCRVFPFDWDCAASQGAGGLWADLGSDVCVCVRVCVPVCRQPLCFLLFSIPALRGECFLRVPLLFLNIYLTFCLSSDYWNDCKLVWNNRLLQSFVSEKYDE